MITKEQAIAKGFKALTHSYALPAEKRMVGAVMNDMRRGGIDADLVAINEDGSRCEVWRTMRGWRAGADEMEVAA